MSSWVLYAVISAVAAGVTAVFAKAGLEGVPSHLGNAIRTAIVLVLSIGIAVVANEHKASATLSGRTWLFLALSGVATAVSWVAYFKALSLSSATAVTAIDKSSLVVTWALAALLLGERVGWKGVVGVSLIVGGALLMAKE